jgi:CheY-like chemotaxis protein
MTKILIVEDMADNAELTRRILTSRGYDTIHAWDAETGLQMALDQLPDLILLDLGLPDYDGLTLASWLRAFTAWPPETAKQMAESYGCDGYIGKPVGGVNDFAEQVKSFLKK